MTSAQIGNIERPYPSVVRNADILMYDEGLFCGTEQVDRSPTSPARPFVSLCLTGKSPRRPERNRSGSKHDFALNIYPSGSYPKNLQLFGITL